MLASETAVPKYSPPTTMDGMRAPQKVKPKHLEDSKAATTQSF